MRGKIKILLGPIRVPFLTLPPVCIFLGVSVSYWRIGSVNWYYAFLALLGALLSHISVNAFNEYYDFKSGLDFRTRKTPFSGGSGTLPQHPELAGWTFFIATISLLATLGIGLYFFKIWGAAIIPLGLVGILLVVSYTTWITRHPFLCLIAPGLGFGVLWIMGTDFVLSGSYSLPAFCASLVPFFLVNDLLLLNQFPDVEADITVGRRHIPAILGRKKASYIYLLFLFLTYLSISLSVTLKLLPKGALLGLLTIPLAVSSSWKAVRFSENISELIPALKLNVLINLLTPLFTGIGIFISA